MTDTRERLIELLKDGGVRDFPFNAALADHLIANGFFEELQNEAYDLGVDSALHNHFGLSWDDAAGLRKEIARLQAASRWIPVTERLPENDYGKHWKERNRYLVRFEPSGLMCVAHYGYKEYDWWIDGHDCVLSATNFKEVTHWMPLPEPPKEDVCCKDCKHLMFSGCYGECAKGHKGIVNPNDTCGNGVRKPPKGE